MGELVADTGVFGTFGDGAEGTGEEADTDALDDFGDEMEDNRLGSGTGRLPLCPPTCVLPEPVISWPS